MEVTTELPVLAALRPSTATALERFVRTFQRFDATRGGFHTVLRAQCERRRLRVVSRFTPCATDGQAPIEVIVPEARRMPPYRVINAPFRGLRERTYVKPEATMADLLLPKEAAA